MTTATVSGWLADLAERFAGAPALRGVDDEPGLSHAALAAEVARAAALLASWGLGRGDAALVALPDGPSALTAILAVASVAAALPVREVEQEEEYARILDAAPTRMVLMRDRPDSPLARIAHARRLTVVTVATGPAGRLTLSCARPGLPCDRTPTPDDDAILVQTAGTTAQPKIVIISHRSLHYSATQFRDWVGFGPADRALCMMPATHLHGLIRSTLPILLAGGEVMWAPGFDSIAAPRWVDALRPTWISAAPAIHRGLIAAAASGWRPSPVRRIGVGSDRIKLDEVERLGALFESRVIQFYALSEAAPFIAMTPALGARGPLGAVGRVNPIWQVTVLGENDVALPAGSIGEIAVTGGIVNALIPPDGRRAARLDPAGRLRTGDIGWVDSQGFLFVEGRVDDIINRGGEKISPTAVEAVLESHPDVARAVAFGLPDPVLGARVAVVVELAEGAFVDEATLAAHASARLSQLMVPERFFFSARIPVNTLGKVSRRMLTETFAQKPATKSSASSAIAPKLAEEVRQILARSLNGARLGIEDDFYAAGGDSLGALSALVEIEQVFGVSVPPATFARAPNAAAIARTLTEAPPVAGETHLDSIREGADPTLLFAYDVDGRVGFARTLGAALGSGEGIAVFHARSFDPATLATRDMHRLADECTRISLRAQPAGPLCLAGYSFGAHLALAIAQRLVALGREVAFLGVVDDEADLGKRLFGTALRPPPEQSVSAMNQWAISRTAAGFFAGRITYFCADENTADRYSDPTAGWGEIALSGVDIVEINGSHHSFEQADGLSQLGPLLAATKARALANPSLWARASAAPDAVRNLRFEARRAARSGDQKAEITACRAALDVDSAQPAWLRRQLAAALFDIGDREGAAASARAAVAADPWPLTSFVLLAPLMRRLGRRPFLNRMLGAAQTASGNHPSEELWRAEAFRIVGDTAAAEAALRRGLHDAPNHLQMRLRLARVLEQSGRPAGAAELLGEIVEDYPSLAYVFQRLGRLNLAMGQDAAAETALRATLRLGNENMRCLAFLAEALDRLGRPDEAAAARNRAADLGAGRKTSVP